MGDKSWKIRVLGDLIEPPQYGWTTKAVSNGVMKYFRTSDINGTINWELVPYCKDLPPEPSKYTLRKNDILISRAGSVGVNVRISEDVPNVIFASYLIRIRTKDNLLPEFLGYYLNTPDYWRYIAEMKSGIAVPNVNASKLRNIPINLPSLAMQQLIVDQLNNLLPKVRQIKARLENIPILLKKFRHSVLSAACSGKLTEDWRFEQHNPTFYAIDGVLTELRDLGSEIPDEWAVRAFTDICHIATNLVNPSDYQDYPHIAPDNIEKESGKLLSYNTIAEDRVTSPKHLFCPGQIIYSKIRPYLSKAILVDFDGLCSADMYPLTSFINTKYLLYYILSPQFVILASTAGERIVLPKINQKELSYIPVPVPSVEEQTEIVRRVEKLFALADSLEAKYHNAMVRINKIERSILSKAFKD